MNGLGFIQSTDIKHEIAVKISHILATEIAQEQNLVTALEQGLAMGIFERIPDAIICPNCGATITGDFCPVCNQDKADPETLDNDQEAADREVDDLSDSEDADDGDRLESESGNEENFTVPPRQTTLRERLTGKLMDADVPEEEIQIYLFLLQEALSLSRQETDVLMPVDLPAAAIALAMKHFGKSEPEILDLWKSRPFSDEDLEELLEDYLEEGGLSDADETPEGVTLEIRKSGDGYLTIIDDPYDDVVATSAAKGKWLNLGKSKIAFSPRFILRKKEERNEILYKILETIIACRRDFLDAEDRDKALEVLRTRPFQQREVVDLHNLDKGTVSRHFSDKVILTPHGLFTLSELSEREALDQENRTLDVVKDIVKDIFAQGDRNGDFYSDEKVADIIAENHEMRISREYVKYLRGKMEIPNSRTRKMDRKNQAE